MPDFILLMHDDSPPGSTDNGWEDYFKRLREHGAFEGGSAIGGGICVRKDGASPPIAKHLTGYIRVTAKSLAEAKHLLTGNPVYEAGGTVEIRELPRD
ncbi:MAG: hypothetical protein ACKVRO_04230 [Micropepsaceae bacterium]